jgi:hypothetical protein
MRFNAPLCMKYLQLVVFPQLKRQAIDGNGPRHRAMHPAQVKNELVVNVHPNIVVSTEIEYLSAFVPTNNRKGVAERCKASKI